MISKSIKELRKQRGWTLAELGKRLHVDEKAVRNWESGYALPSAENILELSKVLFVTTDRVFGLTDNTAIRIDILPPEEQPVFQDMVQALLQSYLNSLRKKEEQESPQTFTRT